MNKIPYKNFLETLTSFFVYPEVDEKILTEQKKRVSDLQSQMSGIGSREGLMSYIKNDKDSLENLLALLGVSIEYFKRIISFLRREKGFNFQSEWSLSATRNMIIEDQQMMNQVCDLFLVGPNNPSLVDKIPLYKLSSLLIDSKVLERLNNEDFMNLLIKSSFDTKYNTAISDENVSLIENVLFSQAEISDYQVSRKVNIDPVGNGTRDILANYILQKRNLELPSFYLKYSFCITTSNAQTTFKKSVKDLRSYIKEQNSSAKLIVIIDGAGWFARQGDLHDIWDYSDYCLNLKSINDLNTIIN